MVYIKNLLVLNYIINKKTTTALNAIIQIGYKISEIKI